MGYCKCGCGMIVRNIWAKGHCNRKPKSSRQPCACGCGQLASCGRKWLSGHNSKTEEAREKKREMFDHLWRESKFKIRRVWNKGLTTKTSEKLVAVGRKISASYTRQKRLRYQRTMLDNPNRWPPKMTGEDHPNWKGGATDIQHLLRGSHELWKRWKLPILARDGFSCVLCGIKRDLVIHHDVETMSDILRHFISNAVEWDDKKSIVNSVIDYHVENHVSGVTLCRDCHLMSHRRNSPEE